MAPSKELHLERPVLDTNKKARKVVKKPGHGKTPTDEDGGGAMDDYPPTNCSVCTKMTDTTVLDLEGGPILIRYITNDNTEYTDRNISKVAG